MAQGDGLAATAMSKLVAAKKFCFSKFSFVAVEFCGDLENFKFDVNLANLSFVGYCRI